MTTIKNPELTFAIVPRVAAFFSMIGSSWIVSEVLRDKTKRTRIYHRIMLGMSCFDIVGSICYFLGRWPSPPDAVFLPGGVGNQQTCTAQAFFGQAVLATVVYNCVLAIYYLLVIKYGMKERQILKYEKFMHATPIIVWVGTGAVGIAFEIFNPAFFNCWIAPVPINCAAYGEIGDDRPPCTRGYLAPIFQWAIFYAPIWAMIIVVTCIMLIVYCSVFKIEKRNDRYAASYSSTTTEVDGTSRRHNSTATVATADGASGASGRQSTTASRKHSRRVATQGLWYLIPFYITWVFPVVTEITEMATGQYYDPMVVLVSLFLPFQGALNFIVYMRPRYLKYRKAQPDWSIYYIISRTLKKSICCFDTDEDDNFVSEVGVGSTDVRPRRYISSLISNTRHMLSTETNNSDVVSGDSVTNNNNNNNNDDDDDDDDDSTKDAKSTSLTMSKQNIDVTTKTMTHECDQDKEHGKEKEIRIVEDEAKA